MMLFSLIQCHWKLIVPVHEMQFGWKSEMFEDLYYHEVFPWFKTCKQSTCTCTGYVMLQVKDVKNHFRYDHWDKLRQVKVVWDTLQYLYNEKTHQNEIQWLFFDFHIL